MVRGQTKITPSHLSRRALVYVRQSSLAQVRDNARPNPHYFHYGAGVTLYSFVSNQFTGFHHMVMPGTDRDSFYILGGPIENQTSVSPVQFISDTAGSSETIFGLFWLMGFLYRPRLADLDEARFWRLDADADYGFLNDLARHLANAKVIVDNWDDLLRVAGSLKTGKVQPMDLIRSLRSGSRLTSLGAAIAELGRLPKTLHNLAFIAKDEIYRRAILTALNHGETRNKLARKVFHGQKGELRQRYREDQEDQLGALGLVVNIIVLWNTRYMEAALDPPTGDRLRCTRGGRSAAHPAHLGAHRTARSVRVP